MKRERITILAIDEEICLFFKEELEEIFGGLVEVDFRNTQMHPIPSVEETDLILYTDPESLNRLLYTIECQAPTLMMKRTITRASLKNIQRIPKGKKALVANINQYMANETMALIHQLGITHITLYPYYQGKKTFEEVDYIITPKKFTFLPEIEAQIIIIGNRVFDISNILDMLSFLHFKRSDVEEIIKTYLPKVPTFWYGFEYTWENRRVLLTQWKLLLNELESGVLVTNNESFIELTNNKAEEILEMSQEDLMGKNLSSLVKKEKNLLPLLGERELKDELTSYLERDIVVTMKRVTFKKNFYGKIILLNPFREIVEVHQKIHSKMTGMGHYSKYHFYHLIGEDPIFLQAKKISKKISPSNATVLLLGESGTGKEIFAGAIHNASPRKKQPFVAINCSTLPDPLLESQLFGYEEGAFTGAKKGGKIGLFERAHQGTIFLDEIGDLPLNLQARLLRALEEKSIMRVGGDSIISVDVRIIAATNRNLLQLVDEGRFRKDLFFRLNVFQITIPPLLKRKGDIPLLMNHFLQEMNERRSINQDFKDFYQAYHWPGNVRELRNVLKYMVSISAGSLSFISLPTYLKKREYIKEPEMEEAFLLKVLYYQEQAKGPTGRRSLTALFHQFYYNISEMEVRRLLKDLQRKGSIVTEKGRWGNRITSKGEKRLEESRYLFLEDREEILIHMEDIYGL